ncbi:hypothetical protein BASA83_008530 [Batrachochytrium salamandrivorans]|nr:hypothetical protein BASA83_008530 [Batrachochytrium salamandrivorans]
MSLNFGPQWMRKIPATSPDSPSGAQQPQPQQQLQQQHSSKQIHNSSHRQQQPQRSLQPALHNSASPAAVASTSTASVPTKSAWATGRPNIISNPPSTASQAPSSVSYSPPTASLVSGKSLNSTTPASGGAFSENQSKLSGSHTTKNSASGQQNGLYTDVTGTLGTQAISRSPPANLALAATPHKAHQSSAQSTKTQLNSFHSEAAKMDSLASSGITTATTKATSLVSSIFNFPRDVMLSFFQDTSMVRPSDFDDSLGCFVLEGQDPLANLPLSEHEKKLLSLASINSDATTRRPNPSYRQDPSKNSRSLGQDTRPGIRGAPVSDRGLADRSRLRDATHASGMFDASLQNELWDTSAALGSFTGGMFGTVDKRPGGHSQAGGDMRDYMLDPELSKLSVEEDRMRTLQGTQRPSSPFRIGGGGGRSKFDDAAFDHSGGFLGSGDSYNRNAPGATDFDLLRDANSSSMFSSMAQSHSGVSASGLSSPHQHGGPIPSRMFSEGAAFLPGTSNVPPFQFVPPQWVYQDPAGALRGPFTSEQMHNWYKEGYFPDNLPIKCVEDPSFIALHQFVEKYGQQAPFIESLIEQEQLEKNVLFASNSTTTTATTTAAAAAAATTTTAT